MLVGFNNKQVWTYASFSSSCLGGSVFVLWKKLVIILKQCAFAFGLA